MGVAEYDQCRVGCLILSFDLLLPRHIFVALMEGVSPRSLAQVVGSCCCTFACDHRVALRRLQTSRSPRPKALNRCGRSVGAGSVGGSVGAGSGGVTASVEVARAAGGGGGQAHTAAMDVDNGGGGGLGFDQPGHRYRKCYIQS